MVAGDDHRLTCDSAVLADTDSTVSIDDRVRPYTGVVAEANFAALCIQDHAPMNLAVATDRNTATLRNNVAFTYPRASTYPQSIWKIDLGERRYSTAPSKRQVSCHGCTWSGPPAQPVDDGLNLWHAWRS